MRFQSRPTNWPLLTIESPVAQWLEHPTRSRRVVGSNPIWDSEFFSESTFLLIFNNNNENNIIIRTSPQSLLLFITKCICNYLIYIMVDLHSFVHVDGSCSHCHLDPYAMLRPYLESSF